MLRVTVALSEGEAEGGTTQIASWFVNPAYPTKRSRRAAFWPNTNPWRVLRQSRVLAETTRPSLRPLLGKEAARAKMQFESSPLPPLPRSASRHPKHTTGTSSENRLEQQQQQRGGLTSSSVYGTHVISEYRRRVNLCPPMSSGLSMYCCSTALRNERIGLTDSRASTCSDDFLIDDDGVIACGHEFMIDDDGFIAPRDPKGSDEPTR